MRERISTGGWVKLEEAGVLLMYVWWVVCFVAPNAVYSFLWLCIVSGGSFLIS